VSNVGTITVQLAGDGGLPHACGEIAAQLRDEQDQRQRQDEAGDGIAVRRVRGGDPGVRGCYRGLRNGVSASAARPARRRARAPSAAASADALRRLACGPSSS
jgi:hypothetical protein